MWKSTLLQPLIYLTIFHSTGPQGDGGLHSLANTPWRLNRIQEASGLKSLFLLAFFPLCPLSSKKFPLSLMQINNFLLIIYTESDPKRRKSKPAAVNWENCSGYHAFWFMCSLTSNIFKSQCKHKKNHLNKLGISFMQIFPWNFFFTVYCLNRIWEATFQWIKLQPVIGPWWSGHYEVGWPW